MHTIKLFFSSVLLSVSALLPQSHTVVSKPITPPVRAIRPSAIAFPFSSSTNTVSRFGGATTTALEQATGTGKSLPVKQSLSNKSTVNSSPVKQQVPAKSTPTTQITQKKVVSDGEQALSQSVAPKPAASSSVSQVLPPQTSGGSSQLPLTDDPNQPLPDTGNPCDILDEGAMCMVNGVSGTCQIHGEYITCTP